MQKCPEFKNKCKVNINLTNLQRLVLRIIRNGIIIKSGENRESLILLLCRI